MSLLNDKKHPPKQITQLPNKPKIAYCRCWQSNNMPFCDGAHRAYNTTTGDSLGPLVITRDLDAE